MNEQFAFLSPLARELAAINVGQAAPNSEYKLKTYSPYNLKDEKSFRRWDRAEDIREMVANIESENNPAAIGDKHLANKAYGLYQFRKPALDEVNKMLKLNDVPVQYTLQDMLDKDKATEAFRLYTYYNIQNFAKTFGREPTDVELMVAHNTSYGSVPKGMARTKEEGSYVNKATAAVKARDEQRKKAEENAKKKPR